MIRSIGTQKDKFFFTLILILIILKQRIPDVLLTSIIVFSGFDGLKRVISLGSCAGLLYRG